MCKPNDRMSVVVSDLLDLRAMIEELQAEETALVDEIKAYMGDEENMMVENHKIRYAEVVSKRIDTTALKKVLGDEALDPYTKVVVSRRFSIT